MLYGFIAHDVLEEWDAVMQYQSGLAFYQGQHYSGWASHFWPPLFPLLLASGDPLFIGKLIAVISGAMVLTAVYFIFRELRLGVTTAALGTLLLASNKHFLLIHLQAENHSLEAAFVVGALLLFLVYQRTFSIWPLIICAFLIGCAGLTRYTAYAVALCLALIILARRDAESFWQSALFSSVFILVSLLWWIPNDRINGSPLSTWQYLNVGSAVYPGTARDWWWQNQLGYSSGFQIIMDYPSLYIQNFVGNLFKSGRLILEGLTSNKYLSLLILAIVIWLRYTSRLTFSYSSQLSPLLLVIVAFALLCSNAFIFYEALWPVAIVTYMLIFVLLAQPGKVFSGLIGALIAINIAISLHAVIDYTQSQRTEANGQLVSLSQINTILSEDPDIANRVIMSSHPARAFYAQSRWVMFPAAGYQSACDLIKFNYPKKIKEVTPKIPVNMSIDKIQPDYLIVDRKTAKRSSQLDSSLNFIQADCINQLELLFGTDSVRLYRIKH